MRAFICNAAVLGSMFLIAHAPTVHAQTDDHKAVVAASGVTIEIDTEAWRGEPRRFDKVLPVLVRIENDGQAPIRLRHTDFALVTESGERVVATPPFELEVTESVLVDARVDPITRLRPYGNFYRGYPFYYPFGYLGRAAYFGYPFSPFDRLSRLQSVELPTPDMVSRALPEVVVEPGERVTGFVYFVDDDDHVDLDHAGRVDFRVELVNAETREPIDTVGIPLLAKSDRLEVASRQEN